METGAFGTAAARNTPANTHGPTAVARQSRTDLRRMFDRFASASGGGSQPAILPEGFSRLVRELFPYLECTQAEVAEGFVLADTRSAGRLEFDSFADWCVLSQQIFDKLEYHFHQTSFANSRE